MIEEIIYTSAPKGLRAGSRGFCTVVSTAGMAANMAERLESMSGYRHAFPLNDPNNSLNPVNYAHVTTRMAGQKRHVVSRVSDAGQDYSGRTNKLAHHVALENVQSLTAGPGRLLLAANFFTDRWNGRVETRPPRAVTNPEVPTKIQLSAWQAATGDGGWAGYVAEQLLASKAPVNVIFAPGTKTLPLVVEVLDLVPVSQRWAVTFSTYFTRLLAGTECQLRFFLDGTSEATTIRNDARAITIDLTKTLPSAEGGPLVDKARSGVLEYVAPIVRSAKSGGTNTAGGKVVSDAELTDFLGDEPAAHASNESEDAAAMFGESSPDRTQFARTFGNRRKQVPITVIAAVAVALVFAVGIGAFLLSQPAVTRQDVTEGDAPAVSEPVTLVEVDRTNESHPPEGDADRNTELISEPVPVVINPFGNQKPFDSIRGIYGHVSGASTWQLPSPGETAESSPAEVFVGSPIHVLAESRTSSLLLDETMVDGNRQWRLSVGSHVLGAIVLESSSDNRPAALIWKWDDGLAWPKDLQGSLASALRILRDSRIKLTAQQQLQPYPQPADTLFIQLAGDAWPRFAHLGSGTNNLGRTLGVPIPGAISDDGNLLKNSQSVLLDAQSPEEVTMAVVSECNSLLEEHDAYLTKALGGSATSATWNLGLKPKDGDSKDGEIFGRYSLSRDQQSGLMQLAYAWQPNVDAEFAAPLQWIPVEISISGQKHILFPRGPQRFPSQELLDLGQADVSECPSTHQPDIPLRFPNENVNVNFEVKILTETGPVECSLKATRQNPTPEIDLAHFQLASPLKLSSKPIKGGMGLGDAVLKVSPSKAMADVIPSSIRLRTVSSFNRSNLFHLNSVHLINVFDPKYWNEKGRFMRSPFQTAANNMLNHIAEFSLPLNPALRHSEDRLAKFGKLKDSFNRIESHLNDSTVELDRLLNFAEVDLRPVYSRIPSSLLKQRSDPQVKALLQKQFNTISEIRDVYTDRQWKTDTETVRRLQEELAQLVADVDISLELKRANGRPLRLYFVSTSRTAGAK